MVVINSPTFCMKRKCKRRIRFMKTDTIAAIATGMTNSGIGIIRISGPDSVFIADKIFRPGKKYKAGSR